jgi:hypothetical protein
MNFILRGQFLKKKIPEKSQVSSIKVYTKKKNLFYTLGYWENVIRIHPFQKKTHPRCIVKPPPTKCALNTWIPNSKTNW